MIFIDEGNNNGQQYHHQQFQQQQQQQHQQQDKVLREYSTIITEKIKTQTLFLNGKEFDGETFRTEHHDIGYHFELGDDDENYEEGKAIYNFKNVTKYIKWTYISE